MPRNRKSTLKSLLKGLASAIIVTLIGMLLIAAALTFLDISDGRIRLFNQLVKIAAIIAGTCAAVCRGGEMGLATGTLLALAYMALGYVLYVALGGSFSTASMLGEMLIGAAVGAVTGTLRANMPAKKRRS